MLLRIIEIDGRPASSGQVGTCRAKLGVTDTGGELPGDAQSERIRSLSRENQFATGIRCYSDPDS